jgi:hypothetical protein
VLRVCADTGAPRTIVSDVPTSSITAKRLVFIPPKIMTIPRIVYLVRGRMKRCHPGRYAANAEIVQPSRQWLAFEEAAR